MSVDHGPILRRYESALEARAGDENALFGLIVEVEDDDALPADERERLIERIADSIREARCQRGLSDNPTAEEILAAYDGQPPVPLDELRQELPPGWRAGNGVHIEIIAGLTRVFPVVVAEGLDGSSTTFFPVAPAARNYRR